MKVKKTKPDDLVDAIRQLNIREKTIKHKCKDRSAASLVKIFGAIGCSDATVRMRGLSRSFCAEEDSSLLVNSNKRGVSLTRSNDYRDGSDYVFDAALLRGASFSPSSSCYHSSSCDPFSSSAGVLYTSLQSNDSSAGGRGAFKTGYNSVSKLRRSYATGLNSSSGYSSLNHAKITNSSSAVALSNLSLSTMHQLYSLVDFPLMYVRQAGGHMRRASGSVSARNSLPVGLKHHPPNRIIPCGNQHDFAQISHHGPLFCYTANDGMLKIDEPDRILINSSTSPNLAQESLISECMLLPNNTPVESSIQINQQNVTEPAIFSNTSNNNDTSNTAASNGSNARIRRNSDPESWQTRKENSATNSTNSVVDASNCSNAASVTQQQQQQQLCSTLNPIMECNSKPNEFLSLRSASFYQNKQRQDQQVLNNTTSGTSSMYSNFSGLFHPQHQQQQFIPPPPPPSSLTLHQHAGDQKECLDACSAGVILPPSGASSDMSAVITPTNVYSYSHAAGVTAPVRSAAAGNNTMCDEEFSVDELASYLEYMVHIPGGKMSEMAERMYL